MVRHIPEAKISDIEIVSESGDGEFSDQPCESSYIVSRIDLMHHPSGERFTVYIDSTIDDNRDLAKVRAEAKLGFIKQLHGKDV